MTNRMHVDNDYTHLYPVLNSTVRTSSHKNKHLHSHVSSLPAWAGLGTGWGREEGWGEGTRQPNSDTPWVHRFFHIRSYHLIIIGLA